MRTFKPEACTSESLAEVARAVRWTFACLWTHCDDDGRAVWNPRLVKAALYPLDDSVTTTVIEDDIAELCRVGAVCVYEISGREYLHVPAWSDHQHPNRKVPSKLPPCPIDHTTEGTHAQRSEDARTTQGSLTSVVVVVDGDVGGEVEEGSSRANPRGQRIPDDWRPSAELVQWHRDEGIPDDLARREIPRFRDYWTAQPGAKGRKADWPATWRNWLRRAADDRIERATPTGSTADQRVNEGRALAARLRAEQESA